MVKGEVDIGTAYEMIYSKFLDKINDYEISKLIDDGKQDTVDDMQLSYLKSAIVKFYKRCKHDLSNRNDTTLVFTDNLTDEEIEILATGMVLAWLNPHIHRLQLLKQALSSTDFRLSSQAFQLKELLNLKNEIKKELEQMITDYGYDYYDTATFKTLFNGS